MADRGRVGSLQVGSKRCAQKVMRRNHDLHRAAVEGIKPAIDRAPPVAHQLEHLRHNLKKERLLEDRYMEIDRENKVLLGKMSEIMRQPSVFANAPRSEKLSAKSSSGPVTLNRNGRKQELTRITLENQRLLKAIQKAQPVYSAKKWESDHQKSEALLRNCSSYPVITRLPRVRSEASVLRQIPPCAEDGAGGAGPSSPSGSGQDPKFVLKEGKTIGQVYYLIEMATDGRVLNVSAFNGETQSSLELVVSEKKHRRLYRETDGDYSKIAERLRIENDRLMLDSPEADGA
ncbi:unnamed protein product [Prorocentrum cordatum]|uniref:Uncharacterized protein n=1 Tax=Prorocentrum cordatum TaxID=2364126 RepID=A0ABN9UM81_9DINO|nr:unnamed protein product [Polarella glacialis]